MERIEGLLVIFVSFDTILASVSAETDAVKMIR